MSRIPSLLGGALLIALIANPAAATTIQDPFGDTLGVAAPQHDIEAVSGVVVDPFLLVTLEFFAPVTLVGQGGDELSGVIYLDTDQNTATGTSFLGVDGFDWQVEFGAPLQDGNLDFFLPLVDNNLGDGDQSTFVPVFATGETVQVFIPLASMGGDDGIVDFLVVAGNTQEITDIAPQTQLGEPTTATSSLSVPEPANLTLLSLGLVGLFGFSRPRGRMR